MDQSKFIIVKVRYELYTGVLLKIFLLIHRQRNHDPEPTNLQVSNEVSKVFPYQLGTRTHFDHILRICALRSHVLNIRVDDNLESRNEKNNFFHSL